MQGDCRLMLSKMHYYLRRSTRKHKGPNRDSMKCFLMKGKNFAGGRRTEKMVMHGCLLINKKTIQGKSRSFKSDPKTKHTIFLSIQLHNFSKFVGKIGYRQIESQDLLFYSIKMSNTEFRLRKSLAAMHGTDERKGYFYCLKMLGILPPPPGSGFEQWTFYTPTGTITNPPTNLYNPKCLHDVLIASHATSCEHRSFYFSFYHRHMMILTEIFLNFAHQILLGGEKRLKDVYKGSKYDFLFNKSNQTIWETVFTVYQGLKNIPNQISNHYWNPTDFQNPLDLQVPEELANRESSDEPMDVLFYDINKAYPWETHVPRRWYQTEDLYKKSDINRYLRSTPVVYTTLQKKFINGDLDPRKNPSVFEEMINTSDGPQRKFMYEYTSANSEMIRYRNYLNYHDTKKNMRLNSVTPDESLANYGARSKNLQYITKEEQEQYGLTDDLVKYYNSLLPHYQYAEALFKNNMEEFFGGRTGEISHNYMHNNFKWILSDATFSVTSLVFLTYHGWIDAQIEFKLRRGNAPGNESDQYYMRNTLNDQFTAFPQSLRNILAPVFDSISEDMVHLANSGLSGPDPIDSDSAGIYPVLEWITPTVRQATSLPPTYDSFSPAFCARDLVLTPTNIRDSFHFNDIYQNFYAKNNESRFSFFQGIRTFDYNYNYQIGSDLSNVLDQYATNLPDYLTQMQGIWVAENLPRTNALRIATESFRLETASRTESASLSKEPQQLDEVQFTSIRKLFGTGLELFASYPSNAENGPNPVFLKLRNILSTLPKNLTEKEYLDIERYIDYGIDVYDIFIFGKQNFAESCHKCQEKKLSFIDLDDPMRVRVPKIWQNLQLYALNKVYFDSKEPVRVHSIYDKLTLAPNSKFSDYRLINGAEEIIVKVDTDILTKQAKSIRIDAESYSVTSDSLKNIVTKKFDSFSQNFDFYKIFDVDNKNERIDFDRYVYKKLKGWVLIGGARTKFELTIPNYQRIIRLTLKITRDDKVVRIQIFDSDYAIKSAYYEKIYQF